ncbi:hypothetical protein [Paraburkholderia acidipaludis]|uniref:hypothetical protein n=1 Tax=Paraburkholderia acidipaludis TaxID=660537 RepID=UPI0012EC94F3|nr:hypothetical protein [Paraburkholderia acidipaludis]
MQLYRISYWTNPACALGAIRRFVVVPRRLYLTFTLASERKLAARTQRHPYRPRLIG